MRIFSNLLQVLVIAVTCVVCKADTVDFTFSGAGNFAISFSLPSNPVPVVAETGVGFAVPDVLVTQGPVATTSLLTFASESNGGGLIIVPGASFIGSQLYTGTENSPAFAPGHFALTDMSNNRPVSLVIAVAQVPEPSPVALIVPLALVMGLISRRTGSFARPALEEHWLTSADKLIVEEVGLGH